MAEAPRRTTAWAALLRDRVVLVSLTALALSTLAYHRGWLSWSQWSVVVIGMTIGALCCSPPGRRSESERRFWNLMTLALACWLITELSFGLLPAWSQAGRGLLFLAFCLILMLAAEVRPDLQRTVSPLDPIRRLDLAGVMLFALGLLTYFVLVPVLVNPQRYDTLIPSTYLDMVLHLYLARQFIFLSRSAHRKWRVIYLLIALAALNWFVTDVIDRLLVYPAGWIRMDENSVLYFFWFTPFMLWIVAARLRWVFPEETQAAEHDTIDPTQAPGLLPLGFYAFFFPFLHLLLETRGALDPDLRSTRASVALGYVSLAILLSLLQRRNLRRWQHDLAMGRELLEEEVRHRERMAAMGRLAAGVAHEVGNPLNAMSAVIHNLRQESDDERTANKLTRVGQQIDRIAALLDQMRDLARPPRRARGPCAVGNLLRGALDLVRFDQRAHRIEIVIEIDDNLPAVDGVADQLTQVFLNLALNAFDALAEIETPRLKVSARRLKRGRKGLVEVVFEDNGPGIPPADLTRVFEASFSTKETGMGLGLALARRIALEHRGTILAENHGAGKGARFVLEMPLARRRKDSPPAVSRQLV